MNCGKVVELPLARVLTEPAEPPSLPRFWSAKGAAERFDCSRALLFKLHREGRLRGYRLMTCDDPARRPLRFLEDDLKALIRAEVRR